jgi:hypothetical protein
VLPSHASGLLIRSRHDDPAERRAHARGELVRVAPGRYLRAADWVPLSPEDRVVVRAVAVLNRAVTEVALSHLSAAALWGMPLVGRVPASVTATDPERERTHTGRHLTKYAARLGDDDVEDLDGLLVTSPARTLVDVALSSSRSQAVAALDHSLRTHLCTRDDYWAALDRRDRVRGAIRASWAGSFASPQAESAGESVLRVTLEGLGFPAPELQHPFTDGDGLIGHGDFWWDRAGVLDEFDGLKKYRDEAMRGGLTADEVVIREKIREDRLRALPEVRGVVRTVWADLSRPEGIAAALERSGLVRERFGFRRLDRAT